MNRPRRGHKIEITLFDDEAEQIRSNAKARGLPVATLIRSSALGAELPAHKTGIEAEAIAALNRVGSNLNQLAKAGNAGALTEEHLKMLKVVMNRTFSTVTAIREQVEEGRPTTNAGA